jgi:hypothetical protein
MNALLNLIGATFYVIMRVVGGLTIFIVGLVIILSVVFSIFSEEAEASLFHIEPMHLIFPQFVVDTTELS